MRLKNNHSLTSLNDEIDKFINLGRQVPPLADVFFNSLFPTETSDCNKPYSVRLADKDDHYEGHLELPGFSKKEVVLQVEEQTLLISAEREDTECESRPSVRKFNHTIDLPEDCQANKAKASLVNGILSFSFPKIVKARPTKIKIS